MSLLPQRKKSAEEIAKLRASIGVPIIPTEELETSATGTVETIVPTHHQATVVHAPEPPPPETPAPAPPPAPPGPKPVHSLKRSERGDPVPADESSSRELTPAQRASKSVRSLRKSEQVPIVKPTPEEPVADSKLPFHRHSDEEIAEIRRRDALAMMTPATPNPKLAVAHPALLIPGYLCASGGASCFVFYEFPMAATAACAAAALLIASFIFLRRPISRHHAAFIAVIALFVIVFGALHFFPHLRHAT